MADKVEKVAATVKMTVARGRVIDNGTRKFGEGDEVTLTVEEAKRLKLLGFLKEPGEAETRPSADSIVKVEGGETTIRQLTAEEP